MAKFDIYGIDDLMKGLSQIDVDRIAPKMLEESVPILEKAVKAEAAKHKDTGAMEESIKATGADINAKGHYICVRPTGRDEKGVRNMEKMIYMEYGTSKQKETPVLSPAVRKAEGPVLDKMQEVFNREAEQL